MNEEIRVRDYFTRAAKNFDDIYDNRGGLLTRIANTVFRKGMSERFTLALQMCRTGGLSVLDIGCGAGRFTIPLAEKGMRVVGIDYSPTMINMADNYVRTKKENTRKSLNVEHICCNFLSDFGLEEKFDVTLAIGVFDYLKDPIPFLKKMKSVTQRRIIISFPARYTPQMPIRKMWLATKKCPVYFYTRSMIDNLCGSTGINDYEIILIKAGFLLKAEMQSEVKRS
jgi:2-polyprenyl-3-methyl-5-hydroxy-6-metoxy-1,4-benzoquinol methylase